MSRDDVSLNVLYDLLSLLNEEESKSTFVIAIDFGTTYTGVAYAFYNKDEQGTDTRRIAEKLEVFKSWPNTVQHNADKTPTIISYHTDPPTWGGNVKPQHSPQVAHFKLGLQPKIREHYSKSGSIPSTLAYLDPNWVNPVSGKSAVDFAADYLSAVRKFVIEEALPRQFVPAIWKDSAKSLTRQAAERAGIPRRRLELITEPEAAALYCATISKEVDLDDGDRFLVCDAGGGTVDLISYVVVTRDPFEVEECNEGSGAACGAIFLNKNFENLLRKKLGRLSASILTQKRVMEAMRWFEGSIKQAFNPYDSGCDDEYEVPMIGVKDAPDIGLEEGYLKISQAEIKSIFVPIFDEIYGLINKQMEEVRNKCNADLKTLLLVGGLGSNVYLFHFLQEKLGSKIDIKQPRDGYSAIMRGAVLHRLGFNFVNQRIMRRSYGVTYLKTPFVPGVDPENLREISPLGLPACRDVMRWYVTKGEKVKNGHVVSDDFVTALTPEEYQDEPLLQLNGLLVCEDDDPPKYENDSGTATVVYYLQHTVTPLCLLPVDLTPLKPFDKVLGLKGYIYKVRYDLVMSFGPELVFKLVHEGKVIGSLSAKYSG